MKSWSLPKNIYLDRAFMITITLGWICTLDKDTFSPKVLPKLADTFFITEMYLAITNYTSLGRLPTDANIVVSSHVLRLSLLFRERVFRRLGFK